MLDRIKKVFSNILSTSGEADDASQDLKFSVAILLVEVMHADHHLDERETSLVMKLLQAQFQLDETEAQALFLKADETSHGVVPLHQYTSHLNSDMSYPDKLMLMNNLWRVVYSDGDVDKYEEHLVRRMSDLLHISHKDFIRAKHLAQENAL